MTVVWYQTCFTSSTEGTIHQSIWKNQQPPTVRYSCMAKNYTYWIAVRHYAHYTFKYHQQQAYLLAGW